MSLLYKVSERFYTVDSIMGFFVPADNVDDGRDTINQ